MFDDYDDSSHQKSSPYVSHDVMSYRVCGQVVQADEYITKQYGSSTRFYQSYNTKMSNNIIDQAEQSINSHAAISGTGKQSDSGMSLPSTSLTSPDK